MLEKTPGGLLYYDRKDLPEVVQMMLFEEWQRFAPSFLPGYKQIQYHKNLVAVRIAGARLSGEFFIDNHDDVKEAKRYKNMSNSDVEYYPIVYGVPPRVTGSAHFWISYGRYNEGLYVMIDRLQYDGQKINRQMGRINDVADHMPELIFHGFKQGEKDEVQ